MVQNDAEVVLNMSKLPYFGVELAGRARLLVDSLLRGHAADRRHGHESVHLDPLAPELRAESRLRAAGLLQRVGDAVVG